MMIKDHFLTQETFELKETSTKGVLQTFPLPANIGKYYESADYISHHQNENSLKQKVYRVAQSFNLNYKRNILVQETFKGAAVLDYGCGAGEFLKFLGPDFKTFGYEPNVLAKRFATEKNPNASFTDSLELLEDQSLDAITLWHVFEHVEQQKETLELFYKKLKPQGVLIIAVPNFTSYDAQYYQEFWAAYDVPRHLFHFSKNGMKNFFNVPQWNLTKIKPLLLDAFYISLLSEKYKKNPLFWLKSGFIGAISNFKALKTSEYSSLIYVVKKI